MEYNFEIGKSFAGLKLDIPIKKALKQLGKPIRTYKDNFGMSLFYDNIGLILSYEKENQKWTDLGIQTEKLIYEGENWYDYKKKELINIIKKIYQKKNFLFDFDITEIKCTNEKQYDFYEIGATLFFQNNKLTNVIISKPIVD